MCLPQVLIAGLVMGFGCPRPLVICVPARKLLAVAADEEAGLVHGVVCKQIDDHYKASIGQAQVQKQSPGLQHAVDAGYPTPKFLPRS